MMTLIEGVGDEVIYFIGFAIVIIILALAWNSTSVSEHALFRTAVLVIERRRRRSLNNNNTNISVGVINNNTEARNRPSNVTNLRSHTEEIQNLNAADPEISIQPTTSDSNSIQIPTSISLSETYLSDVKQNEEGETETKDVQSLLQHSEAPKLRHRNVHPDKNQLSETSPFLEKVATTPEVVSETLVPVETDTVDEERTHSEDVLTDGHIRVRLKFLNDTQKLVDARLIDQLGQFKQQHFGEELGNNKIVRLIFNGQLLQRDQKTLQFYGLFDNCVVHCHITSSTSPPSARSVFSPQVELDLSRLMLPLFGLILGLIWMCRFQYRQYFNGTSTFALLCITGFFALSVIAIWLPARNRQV